MPLYDPVDPMDAEFVYWDTPETPMVTGNLCLFEGGPLAFARAHGGMLDHAKPLWEITSVTGLDDGSVAMVQPPGQIPPGGPSRPQTPLR